MTNSEKQRTCRDCLHYRACFVSGICDSAGAMCDGDDQLWAVCGYFSKMSEWVHMPNEDYIDAKLLKKTLQDFSDWCRDGRKQGVDFVLDCVLPNLPTTDKSESETNGDEK